MDRLAARKVRYYASLHYPVYATLMPEGFVACYPDLPGCVAMAASTSQLYATLDRVRRAWITDAIMKGDAIPLPNSYRTAVPDAENTPIPAYWRRTAAA